MKKKIIIGAILVIAAGGAYMAFTGGGATEADRAQGKETDAKAENSIGDPSLQVVPETTDTNLIEVELEEFDPNADI